MIINLEKMEKKFKFNIVNLEEVKEEEHFIIEGYASSNDLDFHTEIIADEAIKEASKGMIGRDVYFEHDKETKVGQCMDAEFRSGKLWVKDEIFDSQLKEHIKSGKLYNMSIGAHVTKVELVYLPELDTHLKVIKGLHFDEHSIVFLGAQSEAKTIRWYLVKALNTNMTKKLKKDLVSLEEVEEGEEEVLEEAEETEEIEKKEEEETEKEEEKETEEVETDLGNEETEGQKVKWTTAYINNLPDSSFAYVELGGEKDEKGRTKPRSLRHLPHKDKNGKIDSAHVRNALARLNQTKDKDGNLLSESLRAKIRKKLVAAAKKVGIKVGEKTLKQEVRIEDVAVAIIDEAVEKLTQLKKEYFPNEVGKSAYSECMKREMKAGKSMKEASKTCKEGTKKDFKKPVFPQKTVRELSETSEDRPIYQVYRPGEMELMEVKSGKVQTKKFKKEILRVGKWHHSATPDGILRITKKALANIVKNFKDKVIKHVYIPLGHSTDPKKNTGEIVDLELSKSGRKLYADLNVKDGETAEMIEKDLIKGISASIDQNYLKKDKGNYVGPTLLHVALVTEPFIKTMGGFVPLSEEFTDREDIQVFEDSENLELQDLYEKVEDLEIKLGEEGASEEEETESLEESQEEAGEEEESETEAELADQGVESVDSKKAWEELLRKGKVVPAQKEAFMALLSSKGLIELEEDKKVGFGKALIGWLEKQPSIVSFEEKGTSEPAKGEKKEELEVPEDIDKFLDKLDLSEESKKKAYKIYKEAKEKEKETTPF